MIQKVVGVSFRPTKNDAIVTGSPIQLVHDKGNQYSSRAIAVQFEGQTLGFIGEKQNHAHEKIFAVLPVEAKVCTISRLGEFEEFANFKPGEITHLEIEFAMHGDTQGKLKSFNEDAYLTFIKSTHKYTDGSREFISASKYIKRWIAEFDQEKLSGMCADKYGCTQQQVLDFWSGSGAVAADFGTVVHNALDHYEKFKWLGEIVQGQKGLPFNKALPTHPSLRKIVEDFYKQTLTEGKVVTEILLTNMELGLCGQVDRLLITGEKRCRIQDYKVNINADEIDSNVKFLGQMVELPKTKLSKYRLQMSFYAKLLQLSGWVVEGLDAFVYEGEWKHYELDIIPINFGGGEIENPHAIKKAKPQITVVTPLTTNEIKDLAAEFDAEDFGSK